VNGKNLPAHHQHHHHHHHGGHPHPVSAHHVSVQKIEEGKNKFDSVEKADMKDA